MLRPLVNALARQPPIFDALRYLLEGGFREHHRLLQQYLPAGTGRVLDIGCGTGIYAAHFAPADYLGIDVSADYVQAAARRCPDHRFVVMNACHMQLPDQPFAAAFISGVLHHLSDSEATALLQGAARVVRHGGRLLIWEDIPAQWWNPVGQVAHALDLGSHIRRPGQYRQLIEANAQILESHTLRSGFMDYVVFVCSIR